MNTLFPLCYNPYLAKNIWNKDYSNGGWNNSPTRPIRNAKLRLALQDFQLKFFIR